ncbi:MAG: hypothetical protein IRY85_17685 [Micromonosporaceae bacterium]|nr:hypothetical protein [Micromonosporaceae bacterium]
MPWLVITDGTRSWYQRVMWEPWLDRVEGGLWIVGRRVGRGPFVADVAGHGRLWPAGPAKPREPRWLEYLTDVRPSERQSRVSALVHIVVPVAALVGVLVLAADAQFAAWRLVGLVVAGQVWLLVLYTGGVPLPVPRWWRWSSAATTRRS